MKILARILALFLIMPVVELALLVQVDKLIGFLPTIGIILFTGIVGGLLAKREGLAVWKRFNDQLNTGGLPGEELLDGVIILCAGALLITPGVVTDFVGFLGLIPPSRAFIRKFAMKRIKKAMSRGSIQMSFGGLGDSAWDLPDYGNGAGTANGWAGEGEEVPGYASRVNDDQPEDLTRL